MTASGLLFPISPGIRDGSLSSGSQGVVRAFNIIAGRNEIPGNCRRSIMSNQRSGSGCSCGVSRRRFIAGCAACVGGAGLLSVPSRVRAAQDDGKVRIRIVYSLHGPVQQGPDWPNKGFDFRPVMDRVNKELANPIHWNLVVALMELPGWMNKINSDLVLHHLRKHTLKITITLTKGIVREKGQL